MLCSVRQGVRLLNPHDESCLPKVLTSFGLCCGFSVLNELWTVCREEERMTSETFSTRLNEVIRARGLTKRAVAELCKINYHTLNAVLTRDNAVPNAEIALQIADGLGVRIEWLVTGRQDLGAPIDIIGTVGPAGKVDYTQRSGAKAVLVDLPRRLLQRRLGALLVDGNVLEPYFQPGDVLFVEKSSENAGAARPDLRAHLVSDQSGTEWIKCVRVCPETGILKAFQLYEQSSTAQKTDVLWAAPVLLAVSGSLVDLIP